VKLVHLVGFIKKKFVTTHGHTNVKYEQTAGFSTAELRILEFNVTERNVPGSISDRVCMPANVSRDFYRSKFVCKPI
jgi:hypothetical protein